MKNIKLLRSQLDQQLDFLRRNRRSMPAYTGQWIKLLREALGMRQVQLAKRLKITPQALNTLENSALKETITIASLKKIADKLQCSVYVTLIPEQPLEEIVRKRAVRISKKVVMATAKTMSLEKQEPSQKYLNKQIEELAEELIRKRDKRIWEDE